jgi:hypothetical protein
MMWRVDHVPEGDGFNARVVMLAATDSKEEAKVIAAAVKRVLSDPGRVHVTFKGQNIEMG